MNKLFAMTTFISYLILSPVLGAQLQERPIESRLARVALALQSNPEAQRDFLEMAYTQQFTYGSANVFRALDQEEDEDPTGYALTPLLAHQQITLKAADIINNTTNAQNIHSIFYVDLDGFDFTNSVQRQKLRTYFQENPLYNLRYLNLQGAKGLTIFINEFFAASQSKDRYVSLFRINAEHTDITTDDFDKIYNHFLNYTFFIRDLRQISDYYDVTAVFLRVEVRGVNNLGTLTPWVRGKKSSGTYKILYRSIDANAHGPLIMSVES